MKLILTRHGETVENAADIMQGHIPGTLSAEGKQQAERLAERLKNEKIDAIYSSDLARAADTAKVIAKHHPNAELRLVKELRERDLGEFTGKTKEQIGPAAGESLVKAEPKHGETLAAMRKRAADFLDKVMHKHANDTVVFVGHSGINQAVIAVIIGLPAEELPKIGKHANASISIFEVTEDRKHKVHALNDVSHLT